MSESDPEAAMRGAFETIGEEGVCRLVAAFYRQVPEDEILGPMYPKGDLTAAETRLREFLLFRWGGRPGYIERRGHPKLRLRHAPFAVNMAARNRWVTLMDRAFETLAFPTEAEAPLKAFLHATATFLVNRPVA